MTYKVLLKLLKVNRQRKYLTGEEKHSLLEAQSYACTLCGERAQLEWDHTHRFSESSGDQAMVPLCKACHASKTASEPHSHEPDPLASHFEQGVFDHYVLSPRQPPLVFKVKAFEAQEGCKIVDVRRCRKRALEFNVHDIPVFCRWMIFNPRAPLSVISCMPPSPASASCVTWGTLALAGCIASRPSSCSITAY